MVGISSSSHFVSKFLESVSSFKQAVLGQKPVDLPVGLADDIKPVDETKFSHLNVAVIAALLATTGIATTLKLDTPPQSTKEKQSAARRKGDISLGAQRGKGSGGQGSAYQLPAVSKGAGSQSPDDNLPRGGAAGGRGAHYKQPGKLQDINYKHLPDMGHHKPGSMAPGTRKGEGSPSIGSHRPGVDTQRPGVDAPLPQQQQQQVQGPDLVNQAPAVQVPFQVNPRQPQQPQQQPAQGPDLVNQAPAVQVPFQLNPRQPQQPQQQQAQGPDLVNQPPALQVPFQVNPRQPQQPQQQPAQGPNLVNQNRPLPAPFQTFQRIVDQIQDLVLLKKAKKTSIQPAQPDVDPNTLQLASTVSTAGAVFKKIEPDLKNAGKVVVHPNIPGAAADALQLAPKVDAHGAALQKLQVELPLPKENMAHAAGLLPGGDGNRPDVIVEKLEKTAPVAKTQPIFGKILGLFGVRRTSVEPFDLKDDGAAQLQKVETTTSPIIGKVLQILGIRRAPLVNDTNPALEAVAKTPGGTIAPSVLQTAPAEKILEGSPLPKMKGAEPELPADVKLTQLFALKTEEPNLPDVDLTFAPIKKVLRDISDIEWGRRDLKDEGRELPAPTFQVDFVEGSPLPKTQGAAPKALTDVNRARYIQTHMATPKVDMLNFESTETNLQPVLRQLKDLTDVERGGLGGGRDFPAPTFDIILDDILQKADKVTVAAPKPGADALQAAPATLASVEDVEKTDTTLNRISFNAEIPPVLKDEKLIWTLDKPIVPNAPAAGAEDRFEMPKLDFPELKFPSDAARADKAALEDAIITHARDLTTSLSLMRKAIDLGDDLNAANASLAAADARLLAAPGDPQALADKATAEARVTAASDALKPINEELRLIESRLNPMFVHGLTPRLRDLTQKGGLKIPDMGPITSALDDMLRDLNTELTAVSKIIAAPEGLMVIPTVGAKAVTIKDGETHKKIALKAPELAVTTTEENIVHVPLGMPAPTLTITEENIVVASPEEIAAREAEYDAYTADDMRIVLTAELAGEDKEEILALSDDDIQALFSDMRRDTPAEINRLRLAAGEQAGAPSPAPAAVGADVRHLNPTELLHENYSRNDILASNYPAGELLAAGFTADELTAAGYDDQELLDAGYVLGAAAAPFDIDTADAKLLKIALNKYNKDEYPLDDPALADEAGIRAFAGPVGGDVLAPFYAEAEREFVAGGAPAHVLATSASGAAYTEDEVNDLLGQLITEDYAQFGSWDPADNRDEILSEATSRGLVPDVGMPMDDLGGAASASAAADGAYTEDEVNDLLGKLMGEDFGRFGSWDPTDNRDEIILEATSRGLVPDVGILMGAGAPAPAAQPAPAPAAFPAAPLTPADDLANLPGYDRDQLIGAMQHYFPHVRHHGRFADDDLRAMLDQKLNVLVTAAPAPAVAAAAPVNTSALRDVVSAYMTTLGQYYEQTMHRDSGKKKAIELQLSLGAEEIEMWAGDDQGVLDKAAKFAHSNLVKRLVTEELGSDDLSAFSNEDLLESAIDILKTKTQESKDRQDALHAHQRQHTLAKGGGTVDDIDDDEVPTESNAFHMHFKQELEKFRRTATADQKARLEEYESRILADPENTAGVTQILNDVHKEFGEAVVQGLLVDVKTKNQDKPETDQVEGYIVRTPDSKTFFVYDRAENMNVLFGEETSEKGIRMLPLSTQAVAMLDKEGMKHGDKVRVTAKISKYLGDEVIALEKSTRGPSIAPRAASLTLDQFNKLLGFEDRFQKMMSKQPSLDKIDIDRVVPLLGDIEKDGDLGADFAIAFLTSKVLNNLENKDEVRLNTLYNAFVDLEQQNDISSPMKTKLGKKIEDLTKEAKAKGVVLAGAKPSDAGGSPKKKKNKFIGLSPKRKLGNPTRDTNDKS